MSIDELIESAEEKSRVHEYHADFLKMGILCVMLALKVHRTASS